MKKGNKHTEASPLFDKIVFDKVVKSINFNSPDPQFDRIVVFFFANRCLFLQFDQVKQGLGGNVRLILSGAAPLSAHVEGYLRVVTCAHVLQGYGMLLLNLKIKLTPCHHFLKNHNMKTHFKYSYFSCALCGIKLFLFSKSQSFFFF